MRFSISKFFLLIVAFLIGLLLYQKLNSRQLVQAEWFNDSWAYRNYLPITSHTAAESNVYIIATLNIGSTANAQSDLGDLRLTLQNGQIVPHYIASGLGTTAPVVHIYLKDFPAGAQTLYYYYGHSTVQNGFSLTGFPTQAVNYVVGTPGTQEKTQGPLAYWKFDEGSGTTANDYTSERNNLTLSTTTWQNDNMCISGNCLYYNGDSNYASTLSNTKLEFAAADKFTLQTWFRHNNNWEYKTPIDITYSSSPLTDFQIKFTTDTLALINAGKLRSDCNDLRFYDENATNNQRLSYWIEGGTCNTTSTIVWVKIPSISGNKTIYMVYGNDQAPAGSNGDNVFDAFDDFNGSSIDTNKWSDWNPNSWGTMTVSNGILTIDGSASTGGSEYARAILSQNTFTFSNHVVETKSKRAFTGTLATNGYYQENGVRISSEAAPTSATSGNQYKWMYQLYNGLFNVKGRYDLFGKITNGSYAEVNRFSLSEDNPANYGWLRYNWYSGPNQQGFRSTDNTTYSSTWTATDALFSLPATQYFGYYIQSKQTAAPTIAYLDWIRIRKYAATEPTASVGTETNITLGATSQVLLNKFNTSISNGGYQLSMGTDGNITFAVSDSSATFPKDSVATTAGTYGDNNWHFVTAVKDGTASLKLYIDGNLVSTNSTVTSGSLANSQPFYVGSAGDGASNTWQGYIDEVKVYYYARSASQISADYNTRGAALPKGNAAIIGANRENIQSGFTGPVAYWKMDEGVGTTIYDNSGNNHIIYFVKTGSNPTWGTGKFGKSLYYDGGTDWTNFSSSVNQINSVSFWAKPTTTTQIFIDFDNGTHYISASSGIVTATGFDTPTIYVNGIGTSLITANVWQHISVTTGTGFTGSSIGLGLKPPSYYNGYLDELRLYNYARSQKQIIEDMNAGHPYGGSPVGSQVAYYKFDEDYGSTAYNTIAGGSNLNGTMIGTSAPSRTNNGQYAKALSFDGGDYVVLGDQAGLKTTSRSITFWAKNTGSTNTLTGVVSASDSNWYVGFASSGRMAESHHTSVNTQSLNYSDNYVIRPNEWTHYAYIIDTIGSNVYINFYLNGLPVGSTTKTNGHGTNYGTNFLIGSYSTTLYRYTGLLDEVKIYSTALTANEIKTDYNQGRATNFGSISQSTGSTAASNSQSQAYCVPGDTTSCDSPVGQWNLDEPSSGISAVTRADSSGNNNILADPNNVKSYSGKINKGITFENTTDSNKILSITNATQTGLGITGAITISGWVNPYTVASGGYHTLAAKGTEKDASDDLLGYFCGFYQTGSINRAIFRLSSAGTTYNGSLNGASYEIPINQWTHLSCVYNGTNIIIYVNGKFDTSTAYSSGIFNTTGPFSIGGMDYTGGGSVLFDANGKIDQVKVYNYARTPAQIAYDYNRGQPAHWLKMDECQGTTLYDSINRATTVSLTISGSGTQSTPGTCATAGTAWGNGVNGKFNSSVNFDGVDDTSALTTLPIQINAPLSLSMWIKPAAGGPTVQIPVNTAYGTGGEARVETWDSWASLTVNVPSCGTGSTAPLPSNFVGNWHHIIRTYEAGTVKTYIDGKLFNSKAYSGCTPLAKQLRLSYQAWDPDDYYRGQLDEVQIYSYALTPTQVKTLYNQNFAVRFGPPASP